MKKILFVVVFVSVTNFIFNNTVSMYQNHENVSSFLQDQFKKSCYAKSEHSWGDFLKNKTNLCEHVFVTPKVRMERRNINGDEVIETIINFKKEYLGRLKNNLYVNDQSMRSFILNLIELTKSSGQLFGDVFLDSRTFCSGPIYVANGNRGTIKCQTFLGKK